MSRKRKLESKEEKSTEEKSTEVDEPVRKKQKIECIDQLLLVNSLSDGNRKSLLDAYNTNNESLFQIVCNSLHLNQIQIEAEIKLYSNFKLHEKYRKLPFHDKRKLFQMFIKYKDSKLSNNSFIKEGQHIFRDINQTNFEFFVQNIISTEDAAFYPNDIAYSFRNDTKPPKHMNTVLKSIWKRKKSGISKEQNKTCLQMQYELNIKIKDFKKIVGNEYDCRLNFRAKMDEIKELLNKQHIKSNRVLSLKEATNNIRKFKKNDDNWNRYLKWRCEDMIQLETLLTRLQNEIKYLITGIKDRMIHILKIAKVNTENELDIKVSTFGFGKYKPQSIFNEYKCFLSDASKIQNDISNMISDLSEVDVTGLIGNQSKEKRAKQAQKMKQKNAKSAKKARKKKQTDKVVDVDSNSDIELVPNTNHN